MLRFLADENFDGRILRALLRRVPELDVTTAQAVGLQGRPDPEVLERAAAEGRILLSHDLATIPPFAMARVGRGQRMPGVIIIPFGLRMGAVLDDLLFLIRAGSPEDFENQLFYVPL